MATIASQSQQSVQIVAEDNNHFTLAFEGMSERSGVAVALGKGDVMNRFLMSVVVSTLMVVPAYAKHGKPGPGGRGAVISPCLFAPKCVAQTGMSCADFGRGGPPTDGLLNGWFGCAAPACPATAPTTQPVDKLDQHSRDALLAALADEQLAEANYAAIITKFGDVRPFSRIIVAEKRHQELLVSLMNRYGVEIPKTVPNEVKAPASLTEACATAIKLEKENVAMYDRLLVDIHADDIRAVMNQLRTASAEHHLPALQRASARNR